MLRQFYWRVIFLLLLMVGLTGPVGLGPGGAAAAQPQAVIPETTHDFGQAFEDRTLNHTFIIKNTGDAPLKILEVDPDCACTVAEYDETIPPGGQGKVTLGIKPYSVLRQFQKKTKVRFNDPDHPKVILTLEGVVKPIIEIQPSHIIRFRGNVKEKLEGRVRFISHLSGPWEIKSYRASIPDKIEVTLKAEEPGRVYVVEVRNKNQQAGHYAGFIELFTTAEKRPRLIVRVFADLYPESAGAP